MMPARTPVGDHAVSNEAASSSDLLRINERLRTKLDSMEQAQVVMAERLREVLATVQTDRDGRRAALNLIEDALESRRMEQ